MAAGTCSIRSGEIVNNSPFEYLRHATSGRWIAGDGEQYAVVDETGTPLTDFVYDQINNFSEGLAAFYQNRLCGYLSLSGEEVQPAGYGLAWDFQNGFARAAFRDGIAYIRPDGTVPFVPKYFEIRDFSEGLAPFQED